MIRLILLIALGFVTQISSAFAQQICPEDFQRPSYRSRGQYCDPGELVPDAYALGTMIPCEEMEVDHLISLREAWESGICGEDLRRLANDPRNLRFTHWRTNRMKGSMSPEEFAEMLPRSIGAQVIWTAEDLREVYGVRPRAEVTSDLIDHYVQVGARFVRVPIEAVASSIERRIVYRQVAGRTVAFVGRRAVGYALGVGAAADGLMVAAWAVDYVQTPTQDDRMRARAEFFEALFSEPEEDNE